MITYRRIQTGLVISAMLFSQSSYAYSWNDLWYTPDQQGARLLSQGKPVEAAEKFADPRWKGIAYYRAGKYDQAVDTLKTATGNQAKYNLGNALAHRGQYEAAVSIYDEILKAEPSDHDAQYNKNLLQKLLQKQKKNQTQSAHSQSGMQEKSHKSSVQDGQSEKSQSDQNRNNTSNGVPQPEHHRSDDVRSENRTPQDSSTSSGEGTDAKTHSVNSQRNQLNPSNVSGDEPSSLLSPEKQQSENHWLRRIPDDPGGLLRQKFLRDYLRNQNQQGILR